MKPKHAIIVCGPYAAGKTTFIEQQLLPSLSLPYAFHNVDRVARTMFDDYHGQAAHTDQARNQTYRNVHASIERGENLIFDTPGFHPGVAEVMDALEKAHYRITLYRIDLASPELALLRMEQRRRTGGHHIPEAHVRGMWKPLIDAFLGLAHRADETIVYDNSAETMRLVAQIQHKVLTVHEPDLLPDTVSALRHSDFIQASLGR